MNDTAKIKNLWGDLPVDRIIRTPYIMLKEQASLLTEATNGLLVGEVVKQKNSDYIICDLAIKAPSIDNYRVSIVELIHNITIYPTKIRSIFTPELSKECKTEEELETTLGKILSSQEVKRIIAGLLSEIRADEKEVNI